MAKHVLEPVGMTSAAAAAAPGTPPPYHTTVHITADRVAGMQDAARQAQLPPLGRRAAEGVRSCAAVQLKPDGGSGSG